MTAAVSTHERHRLALVVIATAQLMVMLDMTIVNVALPTIQHDLHFSTTNLTWVIDAYVLVFGGLLLLGGRAGDIFGRRRMFTIGIALFAGASLLGGVATSQGWLIAARALQGIGAAIASPTALALVATTFDEGADRHRAMAVYAAMTGAGGALGLVLGGLLVETASWRWVFFVNVPIGATLLILAPIVLPKVDGHGGRLDIPGALAVSGGMAALVYGLIRAPSSGWTDRYTLLAFAIGVVLLITFAVIETRSREALIPPRFLRDRNRAGGFAVILLLGGAMLSLLYFLTQFLQEQLHYSSLVTGVAYLPIPIMVASSSLVVSRIIKHVGTRPFIVAGPLVAALGIFWASYITATSSYWHVFGPLVVTGLGMGLTMVPVTVNAVSGVKNREQGLASSLLNTAQQVGGSLGLAVLVTIAATAIKHSLQSSAAALHGVTTSPAAIAAAQRAAVHGYQSAVRVGALGALLAFVMAALIVRPKAVATPVVGAVVALD